MTTRVDPVRDITVPIIVGLTSGLTLFFLQQYYSFSTLHLSSLIDPTSVADLSAELPPYEEDFIYAAWDLVGRDIVYHGYGSILHFVNSHVKCRKCLVPAQVLNAGAANCVGKSALLTSILRNRMPATNVYMVLGEYSGFPAGGHAWVQVKKAGAWHLIEATSPPSGNPWVLTDSLSNLYIPHAWVNDEGIICYDEGICSLDFNINSRPVPCPCPA